MSTSCRLSPRRMLRPRHQVQKRWWYEDGGAVAAAREGVVACARESIASLRVAVHPPVSSRAETRHQRTGERSPLFRDRLFEMSAAYRAVGVVHARDEMARHGAAGEWRGSSHWRANYEFAAPRAPAPNGRPRCICPSYKATKVSASACPSSSPLTAEI